MRIAETLRTSLPQLKIQLHCGGGNFKKQMKKANASGAKYAVIIGQTEAENGQYGVKPLRSDGEQATFEQQELLAYFNTQFAVE